MKFNETNDLSMQRVLLCDLVFKFILEVVQRGGFVLCPEAALLKGSDPVLHVFLLGHGLQQVFQRENRERISVRHINTLQTQKPGEILIFQTNRKVASSGYLGGSAGVAL